MKKTLIATAIAAISFSGAAFAADGNMSASDLAAKMDSMPNVYGNIQYAIAHDSIDNGPSSVEHFDNGSTLGVTHDHQITPNVTGFFKLELDGFNADDKSKGRGQARLDEAYIGIKGDSFGQIWVGSDDSTYERAIDNISNFYEVATLSLGGDYDTGEGDLIQYMSPSFGGLVLGAAVQINGDGDTKGGADKSYPYQLSATYGIDALELAFAVDSNDISLDRDSVTSGVQANNDNTYGLRATYSMDNVSISGQYQTRKDVSDVYGVIGVYTLGANQFALSYEVAELDGASKSASGDNTSSTVTLQALHNISDNMYVYAEGYIGGGDDVYDTESVDGSGDKIFSDERTIAALGAVYYF
ncbi:porin [Marinobacter psychrophilus]|jgi:predicted porin|uniref:porin n=1 Tax=Marinobacter psychrophilus TaxID=330734 RepID=UPI001B66C729|nr:porin [Marinobacter psychrophilus]MBQ0761696.1 porin [Marinobacter psychrophilus]MBQ0844230.1 porin [Marinobacter psychrophilus]